MPPLNTAIGMIRDAKEAVGDGAERHAREAVCPRAMKFVRLCEDFGKCLPACGSRLPHVSSSAMTILAHFDGKVIVPDGPVDLPLGASLELEVKRANGVSSEVSAAMEATRGLRNHRKASGGF